MKAHTIRSRQLRLRLTGYGILFMIVLATMVLGSINYNNNLGFLLSFLLGGMATVSLYHTYKNLTGLHILAVTAKPVFAAETAVFEVLVRAENVPRAAICFSFPQSKVTHQNINADMLQRVPIRIVADKRGRFNPGPLWIDTQYPLGLFRCIARVSFDVHCLVYPKPIPAPFVTNTHYIALDGKGEKEIPGIDDFQGLQPYQPGEPIEHIYWKAFSKGQGLQMKYFVETAGTTIVFDWNAMNGLNVEQKLSILCGFVLKAHRFNLAYGLTLPAKTIAPDKGDAHRQACLRALALFRLPATGP